MPTELTFDVVGRGTRTVQAQRALNAGYTGRDSAAVTRHVDELARLGVPPPRETPTLYPVPVHLVTQASAVQVTHDRTSGEAEWALVVGEGPDDALLTAACDHTDRALEVHGVAWSKQAAPDVLATTAWSLADVRDRLDAFELRAWVGPTGSEQRIQEGVLAELLSPLDWLGRLGERGLLHPGTVLLGGTIPMLAEVSGFADAWRVELADPAGAVSVLRYEIEQLPPSWE